MFGLSLETKWLASLALAATLLAGYRWQLHQARVAGRDECQAAYVKASRAEEQRRTTELAEVANEAQRLANRARADARGVDAAAPGLRGAVSARLHQPAAPAAAAASAPAGAAPDVLADVLGAAEARLRDLAAIADESRVAGSACERAYRALTP